MVRSISPHAVSWFVQVVVIELRCPQHGFDQQWRKTQNFDVIRAIQENVRQQRSHESECGDELHIWTEISPLPEIFPIEIYFQDG